MHRNGIDWVGHQIIRCDEASRVFIERIEKIVGQREVDRLRYQIEVMSRFDGPDRRDKFADAELKRRFSFFIFCLCIFFRFFTSAPILYTRSSVEE